MSQVKNLEHLLSEESKGRRPSPLKSAFKYFGKDDIVFLGGGLPLSSYFPFDKATFHCPKPPFTNGIGEKPSHEGNTLLVDVAKEKLEDFDIPLARSLQYGYTEGQPELLKFLREHTEIIHTIPNKEWDVIASVGNTQSWEATLRTFCNKGEYILVEEYTFSSAIETARAIDINFAPVPMDAFGIIPEKLDELLNNWDASKGPKPKLLYTISTGQNPTGSSLSNERRQAIYKIACKHDFIIVEDEPYYFLQMDPFSSDSEGPKDQTHDEFLSALVKSFSHYDVEGRVIRLDSFSKILAPGVRLGWIVGQKTLLERYVRLHEVSIQTASGFSSTIITGLLGRWGQSGYIDWLIGLRKEYTIKRDFTQRSIIKHCPLDVCVSNPPIAGMFFTVVIDTAKHPKFEEFGKDPSKVEEAIYEKSLEEGCLMIPGSWFKSPNFHETGSTEIFFRGTFAAVPLEQLDIGIERFGKALRAEFGV